MPNLNERAYELANAMVADADKLGVEVSTLECGTRIIDCGVKVEGSIEAGRRLAEVCLAGRGTVQLLPPGGIPDSPFNWIVRSSLYRGLNADFVVVTTNEPIAACMASQYAGWQITGDKFFAMGSGPMRAAACREKLFNSIGHCEKADVCVGVLETNRLPPESVCIDLAEKCGVNPARLTLLVARTSSAAGTVQIVARSVETGLHKLYELGFDIAEVTKGGGSAPIPPIASDDLTAIGWTNDAILYGGYVWLTVTSSEETISKYGPSVPSSASPDFGEPFAEIFRRYNSDFYKIDPMLFSPALVKFLNPEFSSEATIQFGSIAPRLLAESFAKK